MAFVSATGRRQLACRFLLTLLLLILLATTIQGCVETLPSDSKHQTVPQVDLERYKGLWYEIASFPSWFQKDCYCTTAEYIPEKDYVRVINRCRRGGPEGKWDEAKGTARPVEGSNNATLKVSFFWPFKGDYWVIALDPDYQWVMVGHPQKSYLWILSRTPTMDTALLKELTAKARAMGYPVERLKMAYQACY